MKCTGNNTVQYLITVVLLGLPSYGPCRQAEDRLVWINLIFLLLTNAKANTNGIRASLSGEITVLPAQHIHAHSMRNIGQLTRDLTNKSNILLYLMGNCKSKEYTQFLSNIVESGGFLFLILVEVSAYFYILGINGLTRTLYTVTGPYYKQSSLNHGNHHV